MDALVLRVGLVVLSAAFLTWLALALAILVGRVRYDRARERPPRRTLGRRDAERLVRLARSTPRSQWRRWRRIAALQELARGHHPAVPELLRGVLDESDELTTAAVVRALGDVGDEWAIDVLVDLLKRGNGSRSRIAAELEALTPAPGPRLVPLLRHGSAPVRFWAATLLREYPDLGESTLIELTWDADPNVRAAAVETLGARSGAAVGTALLARLDDSAWFVQVHAARAAGHVVGVDAAPSLTPLLAHERWWVRTAAKDALRAIGSDAVPALLSVLAHDDAFARNGAAEVLQDVGFVDFLALDSPRSPMLERIYEAGGERYREAVEARVGAWIEEIEDEPEARVA